ncbi:MAG TPA: hypothetical protein DIW24_08885 [Bacteroidetes bacterium]|nr:hypothetical protein [Bacteroidota bacterium]HRR09807.1 hypothetical protein [Rhodothermales bacterium]
MTLKHLKAALATATQPLLVPLAKTDQTKVIAIGFKKGMVLRKHKTAIPAKLYVLEGQVQYEAESGHMVLSEYEETPIRADEYHQVTAQEEALCLLIIGA